MTAVFAFGTALLVDLPFLTAESVIFIIGSISTVTVLTSLLAWLVDWKAKAHTHDREAAEYSKTNFSLAASARSVAENPLSTALGHYDKVSRNAVPVPETEFLRLRSEHLVKVRLSRILGRFPAAPIRLLRLRLRFHDTRIALSKEQDSS